MASLCLLHWPQDLVAYAKDVDVRLHSHNDERGAYTRLHSPVT